MKYKLNQILTKYSEKNTNNYEPVAVGRYGIRKRSDIYKKELSNDYLKNKVIFQNVLIIGMGSVQIDVGVLKENLYYSVSPAYHTFKINTSIVLSEYLELLFLAKNSYYTKLYMIASARQGKKVDVEGLLNEIVEIPNLIKQQEIIDKINKINKLTRNYENQLQLLDEIIKSRFVELFGDPITNTKGLPTKDLKDVLILKAGDFTTASDISDIPTHTNIYPCYGGNGIRGYVEEYNQEGEYSLVGRQGALSGNVQYARGKFKNTEHALLVSPIIEMNSIWLNQLLLNLDLKRYQTGAAQPGLSVKNLQEIQILMVPLNVQKVYALFVEQVDKLKFIVEEQLKLMNELLNKKMDEYFN